MLLLHGAGPDNSSPYAGVADRVHWTENKDREKVDVEKNRRRNFEHVIISSV